MEQGEGAADGIFRPSLLYARSSKGEEGRAELGEKGRIEQRCGAEGEGGSRGAARFGSSAQGGGGAWWLSGGGAEGEEESWGRGGAGHGDGGSGFGSGDLGDKGFGAAEAEAWRP